MILKISVWEKIVIVNKRKKEKNCFLLLIKKMGIVIESEEFLVDKVLDISIIFVMGILLLFFFNAMLYHRSTFIMAYMIYMCVLLVYYLIYINNYSHVDKKNNHYNILNFTGIYTVFLNIFVMTVVALGFVRE